LNRRGAEALRIKAKGRGQNAKGKTGPQIAQLSQIENLCNLWNLRMPFALCLLSFFLSAPPRLCGEKVESKVKRQNRSPDCADYADKESVQSVESADAFCTLPFEFLFVGASAPLR
jgi:hypothetical protein